MSSPTATPPPEVVKPSTPPVSKSGVWLKIILLVVFIIGLFSIEQLYRKYNPKKYDLSTIDYGNSFSFEVPPARRVIVYLTGELFSFHSDGPIKTTDEHGEVRVLSGDNYISGDTYISPSKYYMYSNTSNEKVIVTIKKKPLIKKKK